MSKTLIEKLAAAKATVAKLEAQIKSDAIINNIEVGDDVTIKYGRAEKVRFIAGKVVGTQTTDGGLQVAVLSADFKSYTVHARDVTENPSAEGRVPAEPVAEAEVAVEVAEEGDPLEAL